MIWPYQQLADLVLLLHAAVALFVASGLLLIIIGNRFTSWPWVNSWSFRVAHLATIAVVVAESWLGIACPLTSLEAWLRTQAGAGNGYGERSFIEYWLQFLLFYEAPAWVFALVYTLFGLLVALAWWRYPPRSGRRDQA